jgi:CRISPR/Cas system-associated exonuclease Cas4 (RecB family)
MNTVKWSFSSLKQYINCPKQYQEVKVLKKYETRPTQQMRYGTDVHSALENYAKDGTALPHNYKRFASMVDPLLEIDGTRYIEHRMALDENKQPCSWGKGYWVRGIVDFMVIEGDTAFIVDYKTGSDKYPDLKQLRLMALMTFAHFPEVNRVKAGLMFILHNNFIPEEYVRDNMETLWTNFTPDLERLQLSYENDMWQMNPTPLCGWCPVTTCEHYRSR